VVCSNNCAEASGPNRSVTLATPITYSPLQVIEKTKFKSVPKLTFPRRFCDGQPFGRNRKLLGHRVAYSVSAENTSVAEVASK
jgi:hypothetical protein